MKAIRVVENGSEKTVTTIGVKKVKLSKELSSDAVDSIMYNIEAESNKEKER